MNDKLDFYDYERETSLPHKRKRYLEERLSEIVRYAYDHSSATRKRFDSQDLSPHDIKHIEDLEKLNTLDKNDIARIQAGDPPFGGISGVDPEEIRRIYVSPGPIYEPGGRIYEDTGWVQAFRAIGVDAGDIALNTFSYHLTLFGFWLDDSLNKIGVTVIPSGPGNTTTQVELMVNLKVTSYLGTPSFLLSLSEKAESLGYDLREDLYLKYGFVSAEMLPESLREKLENAFGMILLQSYGTADIGCLGFECKGRCGMHIPEDVIVEILDPETGKPVPAGKMGEIVATTFSKQYPLIRFGTGDLSYLIDEPCVCGRTSPRLGKIMGRVDQLTKVRGMFIHPSQISEATQRFPEIERCQLIVERYEHKDRITLLAKLATDGIDQNHLKARLETTLKDVVKLRIGVSFCEESDFSDLDKVIVDRRKWD
ncbi:MAG: AMP-binding protein [Thermodesulfobacteriota bacterium]|nr:AMP-binding protein [Thermodesulfobacteriota bacterium]